MMVNHDYTKMVNHGMPWLVHITSTRHNGIGSHERIVATVVDIVDDGGLSWLIMLIGKYFLVLSTDKISTKVLTMLDINC